MNDLSFYPIGIIDVGKGIWYCSVCRLASIDGKRFEHDCKGKKNE